MWIADVVYPLNWASIGSALLCGGLVGFERQMRGKPAGMRTSILICLGTAIFVELGVSLQAPPADPTRVLGQVVTGIGFLGAGVILARGAVVTGVTSAAVIWLLAGIGCTIGFGHYLPALVLSLVAVGVLAGIELIESSFKRLRRGVHARAGDPNQGGEGPGEPPLPRGQ